MTTERDKARSKRFREKNPDYHAKWRDLNREYMATRRRERKYGLSETEFFALFVEQGGECAICSTPLTIVGPERANVDHDHATGVVRGLLCWQCNTGIGKFRDDPDVLSAASAYLRRKKP